MDATLIARQSIVLGLSRSLKEFIDLEVQTKGCGNLSEDVRGLLRAEQAKDADARLEALLLEGLVSGKDAALTKDFWRELKVDAVRILARKKAPRKARSARGSSSFGPPPGKTFCGNTSTT